MAIAEPHGSRRVWELPKFPSNHYLELEPVRCLRVSVLSSSPVVAPLPRRMLEGPPFIFASLALIWLPCLVVDFADVLLLCAITYSRSRATQCYQGHQR